MPALWPSSRGRNRLTAAAADTATSSNSALTLEQLQAQYTALPTLNPPRRQRSTGGINPVQARSVVNTTSESSSKRNRSRAQILRREGERSRSTTPAHFRSVTPSGSPNITPPISRNPTPETSRSGSPVGGSRSGSVNVNVGASSVNSIARSAIHRHMQNCLAAQTAGAERE